MSDGQTGKRKPGRPRKARDEDARRSAHSVWLSEETRANVIAAADLAGRSMSEEMADRVKESFDRERISNGVLNRAIGDAVVTTLVLAEAQTGTPWNTDAVSARYAFTRIVSMLSEVMGVAPTDQLSDDDQRVLANGAEWAAIIHEKSYREPQEVRGGSFHVYPADAKQPRGPESLRQLGHRLGNLKLLEKMDNRPHKIGNEMGRLELKRRKPTENE